MDSLPQTITRIAVAGYKSIADEQSIEIAPLTLLAGANSSGKSSIMQPLLLLKQTLESPYDSGMLSLYGENVKLDSFEQAISKFSPVEEFSVELEMTSPEKAKITEKFIFYGDKEFFEDIKGHRYYNFIVVIRRDKNGESAIPLHPQATQDRTIKLFLLRFNRIVGYVIHLPGLRKEMERNYRKTIAIDNRFPGTFENYVAGIINSWQKEKSELLRQLGMLLEKLGLTWIVQAKLVNDNFIELQVGRLTHSKRKNSKDMVNIADVGIGVSQVLPVIVALLVAKSGQLVYIEQPEIHLHPRAQVAMAEILADAAQRGVRVVVETHSAIILRSVQTLVAKGQLTPEQVKLHWFTRNEKGATKVTTAELDESGTFGDWPEDFDEIALQVEQNYLDAVMNKQAS